MFLPQVVQSVQRPHPHGGLVTAQLVDSLDKQLLGALLDRVLLRGGGGVAGVFEILSGDAFGLLEALFGVGDAMGLVFELALVLGRGDDLPVDQYRQSDRTAQADDDRERLLRGVHPPRAVGTSRRPQQVDHE
ncbi:hypothetical protein AB0I28_19665 [Phytomonospora sp. NPDC050363]|uniref:hypothetical protein n=1 Tax=Phytomonospora sp. NPDC050363 TaxID=3155642 RepID=UPI003409A57B